MSNGNCNINGIYHLKYKFGARESNFSLVLNDHLIKKN